MDESNYVVLHVCIMSLVILWCGQGGEGEVGGGGGGGGGEEGGRGR